MTHKILVTDDNSDYRAGVMEILGIEGYAVIDAANGELALQLIHEHMPDLILCDIDMPIMTGLQVLKIVKQDDRLKSIPFIIVSGSIDQETLKTMQSDGADAYIQKPMDIQEMFALIQSFLGG